MTRDPRLAFDTLEARAVAERSAEPHDRISLRDHVVEVEIGAFQAERGMTQRVCFNVVVEVRPQDADPADDVDRILSYDRITDAIAAELHAERLNLLETLAERIADRILAEPLALRCFVRIEKLDRGAGALGVEIVRTAAADLPATQEAPEDPRPLVVYLSNAAIASPLLKGWIDRIAALGPAILCVGPSDAPRPQSDIPSTQRRVDLLAIEQNAWILAGCDARCAVVGSRTELDWAMRRGQLTIWAPFKMVVDAPVPPAALAADGPALCLWLADRVRARDLLFIGAVPPEGSGARAMGVEAEVLP